ncbi:hypothetical protein XENTR_v10021951 [Xenopus tropicalis]|uniref:Tetratricopeptide repeat domain 6 n=1 Tax=Xenopus tropicalis TaxID=8364 RepID=A0A6I8PY12_XENTR|nr:tetratricopeptide repeat protein 6 isoform X2 [Xenopus tropicalis]KAE8587373.1 hypothetical protein XENTR_v10021951 [Xenopus tropicalis]KAE8587374.1 hypothetical protein XENTR_v10021951 [Xenopus tropicalis]
MSESRGHLHFRLNYAEEFRIKKELEKLLKRSQKDMRHTTVESGPASNLPLSFTEQSPPPHSGSFDCLSSPTSETASKPYKPCVQSMCGNGRLQEANNSEYKKKTLHMKLKPLTNLPHQPHQDILQDFAQHEEPQNEFILPKSSEMDNSAKRPAIASMLGTTKSVLVFPRPEPPSKPRTYISQVSSKPAVSAKKKTSQKKEINVRKLIKHSSSKNNKKDEDAVSCSTSTTDSTVSGSSSDSDSDDSSDNENRRKKRKKVSKKKQNSTFAPVSPSMPFTELSPVTSAAFTQGQGKRDEQGQTEYTSEKAESKISTSLKAPTVRTVDEIISSLRSPFAYAPSASDVMIKRLMESVGLNYDITYGELIKERQEVQIQETDQPVLADKETPSAHQPADQSSDLCLERIRSPASMKNEIELHTETSTLAEKEFKPHLSEEVMTEQTAIHTLKLPAQVTFSDIIHVKGSAAPVTRREPPKIPPPSFLATWEPRSKENGHQTIHHFCTVSPSYVLPSSLKMALRVHHTVGRKGHNSFSVNQGLPSTPTEDCSADAHNLSHIQKTMGILQHGIPASVPQDQKDSLITHPPHSSRSLEEWQKIAEYYVEGPRMMLVGQQAQLHSETQRMFWAPAPPKFSAPLSLIQNKLFSKYESCVEELHRMEEFSSVQQQRESSVSDDEQEDKDHRDRVLFSRANSLPNISVSLVFTVSGSLQTSLSTSAPDISDHTESTFHLASDFRTSMKELEMWRHQSFMPIAVTKDDPKPSSNFAVSHGADVALAGLVRLDATTAPEETQLSYITSLKKKRSRKKKKLLDKVKLQCVYDELSQPPQALERSESLTLIPASLSYSYKEKRYSRSSSLPPKLDFSSFVRKYGGIRDKQVVREWVRDIWNTWFDEVFPPSRASSDNEQEQPYSLKEITEGATKEGILWLQDSVQPVLIEDPGASVEDLEGEIARLTVLIDEKEKPCAFHCCRRGALNRKLGKLSLAIQDLNLAINLEPQLLDAYWNRHLIFCLQGKTTAALEDLNMIIKLNKLYTDAYLSKAEIYKQEGDYTMSILSYTQALKCRPDDDEIYFRRAQMYEAQDEYKIAMDDYAKCFQLSQSRVDALQKHGMYCFENCNWNIAVQDFTALIKQDINNVEARIFRGRAHTQLANYTEAAEDFSAAIHLNPSNWMAFYYRGCLLRKCLPWQAVQDFSISVLLCDSSENLNAFLYRGILYIDMGLWAEAICDFERVLALDRTVVLAHMNLGLISLLNRKDYAQAIRHFTAALNVDPVYIKAYLCRAQAFQQINDLNNAMKDITRAIHLHPDSPQPYLIRGQYLYEMKKYSLASFCINYAAEMTQGSSAAQQALVQSFRQQYSNAIECLVSAIQAKPAPALVILLGKIQMKANNSKDAVKTFRDALDMFKSSNDLILSPSNKAEILFNLGLCYMEQFDFQKALEALTSAIKVRSRFHEAYYQRGLCRMHLQQAKCLDDFNKALEINPNYFQALLCRATFYGFRKRYSKAIMNCNAAIKVQPHSVRAYLYRGALKYYIKAYKLAVQDFSKAATLDPTCSLVYYNRGVCHHQTKMYDEALKDYSIVLLLGGWKEVDSKVLVNRGLLYLELQDFANALEDFKCVALRTPGDIKIHLVIGNCHQRLQQYEEAVQAFNQALNITPLSAEACIGRGNAYIEYGHQRGTAQAKRDFLRALHLSPSCVAARICLGYTLQAQGLFQQAWNHFTVALDIDPQSILGFEGRAIVSLQIGDTFAALQDMNAALKLCGSAQLLTNRGVIHQFMGKLPNAMRDYQAAITADQDYSLAYFNAANLYLHNRQFTQAKEYYTRAVALDPANESAVLNRGITNMLLQDAQAALHDFQLVLSLCPVSSAAYFNRASLYNTLQQYQWAESDISQALNLQPDDPLIYKLRADIRGKLGLTKEAIEDYEHAITLLGQSAQ